MAERGKITFAMVQVAGSDDVLDRALGAMEMAFMKFSNVTLPPPQVQPKQLEEGKKGKK